MESQSIESKIILNGTKILELSTYKIEIIESINYMLMRLSELSKAFGLVDTVVFFIYLILSKINRISDHYPMCYSPNAIKSEI